MSDLSAMPCIEHESHIAALEAEVTRLRAEVTRLRTDPIVLADRAEMYRRPGYAVTNIPDGLLGLMIAALKAI